ncbi:N-acetylmuramoyl-L-alanine amidase [Pseudoxanthobacter soli DSM 19599]|uniref:N-acetylmuramoyl-L-alanine amidase n=1 Tax=Pseudoxanthobacter soli DSM 19599 TaxID=1123029 RepID=A0A1M7ZQ70_9HYPH|nr:N-acetylmuramoyl-L-alanine amidase [Pseudoxanthobacter soli]SHO66962.1 N-acetylmuramoyl-L-alanine amidase [Pseudoxanthobacter soli DSM 19599]
MKTLADLTIRDVPSPNFRERPGGRKPDMLILHYTGMESAEAAIARLSDREAVVSCHYVVDEDGSIVRMVAEPMRANHAGVSFWRGERDLNDASIGIEIVNPGHEFGYRPFPDAQIEALVVLVKAILSHRRIAPDRILAHSDVAPDRKQDPGELFPWETLAAAGIGHWVPPAPLSAEGPAFRPGDEGLPVRALQGMLALYGYEVDLTGVFDARTSLAVTAFQRHFRPARVDGVADRSTMDTLHRLIGALRQREQAS